jgi:6-pyruvoyltetrahydropterin/6-carboxytetrahydropterin synthase
MDFGGLKEFKQWSEHMFDHTLLVAEDDPNRGELEALNASGLAEVRIVPAVGCERFAEMAYKKMQGIINAAKVSGTALNPTVRVKSVEVFEHGANSAIYEE